MNKRIKELAEQCWDRRLDGVHFDQEKFAALVAAHEREECAKERPVQVSPLEFVTAVFKKEHLIGKPIMWAQWPNEEKSK